jgi:hypothetical protein
MDPVVTLVIEHGKVVSAPGDPVAEGLLLGVPLAVAGWHWVRLCWYLGRRWEAARR